MHKEKTAGDSSCSSSHKLTPISSVVVERRKDDFLSLKRFDKAIKPGTLSR